MKTVKDIPFREVLEHFDAVHPVREEGNFATNGWARGLLLSTNELCQGVWRLVELSPDEVLEICLPHHRGEKSAGGTTVLLEGDGATAGDAVTRLQSLADYSTTNEVCWGKIQYWAGRDAEPIILSTTAPKHMQDVVADAKFFHIDGLHRILAWGLGGATLPVQAFLAGR